MEKPQAKTLHYYDYHECSRFLEEKYGYKERDYAGTHTNYQKYLDEACRIEGADPKDLQEDLTKADKNDPEVARKLEVRKRVYTRQQWIEPEYQDFWHWVLENYEIHNGCHFTMYEDDMPEKDWQKEIFKRYMDEFGDGEAGEREINFYVWW